MTGLAPSCVVWLTGWRVCREEQRGWGGVWRASDKGWMEELRVLRVEESWMQAVKTLLCSCTFGGLFEFLTSQ